MTHKIYQVDAFTSQPFQGNPAGVCILPTPAPDIWMQSVAREMNLSETAFLVPEGEGFHLRWFTPAAEVGLCGHATLASAHILWESGTLPPGKQARFNTHSGLLTADRRGDWIELNFPATKETPAERFETLEKALGVKPVYFGKNVFDYLVEVDSEATVRNLTPDFTLLGKLAVRGVIVTARADSGDFDFVSRFFAPAVGVNEDPVTGSAHCCLTPYWAEKLGKEELKAYQASARGGVLQLCLKGERVLISGQAVTIIVGEFNA